jgi:large subunit ribosomal protein L2
MSIKTVSRVKIYKPTTPGRRKTSVIDYSILTTKTPYKKLLVRKQVRAGRNRKGQIMVRHQGGSKIRKLVRQINFKKHFPIGFKVTSIEYSPGRTALISLVVDLHTGTKHYVLYTRGMEVGQVYGANKDIVEGNVLQLMDVPTGSDVSQLEMNPGQGASLCRSAGNYAIVTAKDDKFVTVKLPSGEIRKFLGTCSCVYGRIGNEAHEFVRIGKAGRKRNMGVRPTVRGKVMNPVDHPHGGGEARNPIGLKRPKTPTGKPALGVRTRDRKKPSNKFILKRRYNKK